MAAFSMVRDTDRLCCQAKTFPQQGKKRKVNSGPGGSSGDGEAGEQGGAGGQSTHWEPGAPLCPFPE